MCSFYPGSSRKQKDYSNVVPEPEKPELDELPDLGKPKLYMLGNKVVELYGIGALALALNRKPITIRKWETEGLIPISPLFAPSFSVRGKRRLYTKDQIKTLRQIAYEEGILYPPEGGLKRIRIENTKFKERAAKAFSSD